MLSLSLGFYLCLLFYHAVMKESDRALKKISPSVSLVRRFSRTLVAVLLPASFQSFLLCLGHFLDQQQTAAKQDDF